MAATPTPRAVPFPSHGGIPPPLPTHPTDGEGGSNRGDDRKGGRGGGNDSGSTHSTPFFPPGNDAASVLTATAARATAAAPAGAAALAPEAPPADEPLALYAADPVAYLARLAEELTLLEKTDGDDNRGGSDGEGDRDGNDDGGFGGGGIEGRARGNGVEEEVGTGGETALPSGDALLDWRDDNGGGGDDSSSSGSNGSNHSWTVPPLPADLLTVEALLDPAHPPQAPPLPPPPPPPSAPETAPATATAAAVDPATAFVTAVAAAGWTPAASPAAPFLPASGDDDVGDLDWDALRLDPLDAAGLGDPDAVPSAGGSLVGAGDPPSPGDDTLDGYPPAAVGAIVDGWLSPPSPHSPVLPPTPPPSAVGGDSGVATVPTATATATASTLPTSSPIATAAGPAVVAAVWSVTSTPPGALTFTAALPGVPSAAAVDVDVTPTDVTVGATTADGATRWVVLAAELPAAVAVGEAGVDAAFSAASGVLTLTLPLAGGGDGGSDRA